MFSVTQDICEQTRGRKESKSLFLMKRGQIKRLGIQRDGRKERQH